MADQEIRADYQELEQLAKDFNKQANDIAHMLQSVNSKFSEMDGQWIGKGANAFFDEMHHKVLPSQQRLQKALERAGQATQKIAQEFKKAEDEASSIFRHS